MLDVSQGISRSPARKAYSISLALGEAKPLHFLHIVLLRARSEKYLNSPTIQTLSNQGGLTAIYRSFDSHVLAVLNSLAVNTRAERIQRLRNLQLEFPGYERAKNVCGIYLHAILGEDELWRDYIGKSHDVRVRIRRHNNDNEHTDFHHYVNNYCNDDFYVLVATIVPDSPNTDGLLQLLEHFVSQVFSNFTIFWSS